MTKAEKPAYWTLRVKEQASSDLRGHGKVLRSVNG